MYGLPTTRFLLAVAVLCGMAHDVFSHGIPVHVTTNDGQLVASNGFEDDYGYAQQVFFDTSIDARLDYVTLPSGVRVALTNLPGTDISGMQPESGLYLNPIHRPNFTSPTHEDRWLWYWSASSREVELAPNEESMWVVSEFGETTILQSEAPTAATLKVAEPRADELGIHVHNLRYLLDNDPTAAIGAYGFFATLSSPSYVDSDPLLIIFNNGLGAEALTEGAFAINAAAILPGDFDDDGLLTVADIDLLSENARSTTPDLSFDVDRSGTVDHTDVATWVHDLRGTWLGDANLDGTFDSSDMVSVFQRGHYEDAESLNSGWGDGDWNADGDFTSGDLVTAFQDGGYESGERPVALPEPSLSTLGLLLACSLLRQVTKQ